MALRLVELLVDRTAAEATQLMIEYDPQPPFDAGAVAKAGDDVDDPRHRVRRLAVRPAESHRSAAARSLRHCGQTAVAQNVSPRALLASVATSTSSPWPYSALSMPRTMPRSTAQITG